MKKIVALRSFDNYVTVYDSTMKICISFSAQESQPLKFRFKLYFLGRELPGWADSRSIQSDSW